MKKFFIFIIIVAVCAAGYYGFKKKSKKSGGVVTKKVPSVPVKRDSILVKLEETGEIEPQLQVSLKSKVSGKIVRFLVEEGDFVNKGDVIAEVEPDFRQANEIASTTDNLKLAEIRLKNAQELVEENQRLFDKNYISEDNLEDAKDRLKEAEISHRSAKQQFELIKEIETVGNISRVIATASGTVIEKTVEEGEMIVASTSSFSEGTVLMVLADLKHMIVTSSVNEIDISKIEKDQEVKIQVDAYPYDSFNGTITKIAAKAIYKSNVKVFPLEISIAESDERLKPGMTANITIIGERRKDILVVPISSIFSDKNGDDVVYKVVNDTINTQVFVKTGINDFKNVEIIEGLTDGDKVSLKEPRRM